MVEFSFVKKRMSADAVTALLLDKNDVLYMNIVKEISFCCLQIYFLNVCQQHIDYWRYWLLVCLVFIFSEAEASWDPMSEAYRSADFNLYGQKFPSRQTYVFSMTTWFSEFQCFYLGSLEMKLVAKQW